MRQPDSEITRAEIHALLLFFCRLRIAAVFVLGFDLRQRYARELLVDRVALVRGRLRLFEKSLEARGIGALDHAEARLVAHVVGDSRLRRTIVETERRFALGPASRIETVQRPNAGIHRELLL